VFDRNCEGHPGPRKAGEDDGSIWRLAVAEGELLPSLHPGAEYLFEYGYLIRDSDRPDGTMGYRVIHPTRLTASNQQISWRLDPGELSQGTVLNHWVSSGANRGQALKRTFSMVDGSGSVAVRVISLGGHRYRYIYAIMNFDLVHAQVVGETSSPRVVDPHGIDRIEIPHAPQAKLVEVHSFGPDSDATVPWSSKVTPEAAIWEAVPSGELTWGSVYTISMESVEGPVHGTMRLHVGGTEPTRYIDIETMTAGNSHY
jgi:hypothetical protein